MSVMMGHLGYTQSGIRLRPVSTESIRLVIMLKVGSILRAVNQTIIS